MKVSTFGALLLATTGLAAAQSPTDAEVLIAREDSDALFTRQDFHELLYTRDESADALSHATRALEHLRRLADDHAEFVARALDEYEHVQWARGFDVAPPRPGPPVKKPPVQPKSEKKEVKPFKGCKTVAECIAKLCKGPPSTLTESKARAKALKAQEDCKALCKEMLG